MKHSKILITGGMGFLGQNLVHQILKEYSDSQIEILVLDLFKNKLLYPEDEDKVKFVTGIDITNFDAILPFFENIELVFHAAAIMKYGRRNRSILNKINVEGTQNVLKACKTAGVRILVHVGSIGMLKYDKTGGLSEGTEYLDWGKEGFAHYGYSKFSAVDLVLKPDGDLQVMIGHPGIMLGPGDLKSQPLFRIGRGFKFTFVPAGGTNFIDVRDVASGLIHIAENGKNKESYLLTNHNLSHKELLHAIAKNKPNTIRIVKLPSFLTYLLSPIVWALEFIMPKTSLLSKEGTIKAFHKRYFDNGSSKDELIWSPDYTMNETIQAAVDWLKSEDRLK